MTIPVLDMAVARPAAAHKRVAAFDGMRGLACLFVVVSHYLGHGYFLSPGLECGGWIGVMMFFVLSGYLIGGILLDNRDSPSYFRTFYIRRAFRIFPIYYVVIALSVPALAFCPWTQQYFSLFTYLTYTVNFFMAYTGEYGNGLLVPVWSLCIEEQFYLLFPILLFAIPRNWRLEQVFALVILLAIVGRGLLVMNGANDLAGKMLLPTRMDALALGALAAYSRRRPELWAWLSRNGSLWIRILTMTGFGMLPILGAVEKLAGIPLYDIYGLSFLGLGFAGLILLIADNGPEARRFQSRVLCFFGTISYCLYLIHLPVLCFLHGLILDAPPQNFQLGPASLAQSAVSALAFAVSVGIAYLSWICFERPLIRYAQRWQYEKPLKRSGSQPVQYA